MDDGPGRERLRFTVLGPVRAWRGATPLAAGSPQQRALLAALLLRGGRTATAAELVDALWGDEPPHAALAALRTYASRLRKALGADADALVSESGGYAIRPVNGRDLDLDHDRAEQYAAEAEKAKASGDRGRARELLESALALWDGEPLAGLAGPYAETQRTRLDEWRLSLTEARLELILESGRHADVVSELTALTAAHPLRERLRELLMLALYRSGRQAEALAVYADTRRLLADELGVDPCASLSDLHQRILRADIELDAPPVTSDGPGSTDQVIVRPQQLPATVADFTGRTTFVSELGAQLATAEGSVMAVSALTGIGGVGKTTLAVHVAHAAREHFPDGQLYVDLQGAGHTPSEPEAVLGSFLRALGTADSAIPDGLEERSALYRSTLAGRRVLALLDNARDAAQIRPLLPGAEGCAALVTSRARMIDLAGAYLIDVDVMSPEEALNLFTRIVGEERVDSERQAAMAVVGACGFLPLAIRIAASRLAARRTWTVSTLARKLADERRRLDELRAGDLAVTATFELGYGQLEPHQARAFRLLGLADGPDISLAAAAALLDMDSEDAEDLIESLVDASLLESAAPGRYRFHDLVRLYARVCAERDEQPPAEREAALSRLLDFYLATAKEVYTLERPGDRLADHMACPQHAGLVFTDRIGALEWLFGEARCLMACAQQSAGPTTLRRAVDLLLLAQDLAESGADSRQYEQVNMALLDAARASDDQRAQARIHVALTNVHTLAGRFDKADEHAQSAMLLGLATEDAFASSYAPNDRGIIANSQNRHVDAEAYLTQALSAFREDRNKPSEASALCNLSRVHLATGRVDTAIQLAQEGIAIYRQLGATRRLANGMYALGLAFTRAERLDDATEQLNKALAIFQASRQRFWEGMTYYRMAEADLTAGHPAQAANRAEQALTALRAIGGEWWHANVLTLLGRALDGVGQTGRARVCWQESLTVFERLGSPESAVVQRLLQPVATI
ncbi:DNA-binding SARP family transcriptional activator [Streptomyces sp. 2333.5]|uniref:AfsR/SARP family transcriptional regulator n=1 Tax=Streptomyces TaxID=1883 RepID=UPI000897297D|nr:MULTISPECIES: BTAD domain-containing putative transcriptional regulator [unclassified Streptomyces]PJJ02598.1 DNA-binding SARP family transcriptional activator [Streptomyces sp. 2333.5]SED17433.1 DNA-binding transcriptional activator of the SARP family [Streptomyces sp. 2314.4]SEE05266.1 DNA-binding transcriptional activator of the SARP family [Streptomyces sp. 2112.2]